MIPASVSQVRPTESRVQIVVTSNDSRRVDGSERPRAHGHIQVSTGPVPGPEPVKMFLQAPALQVLILEELGKKFQLR